MLLHILISKTSLQPFSLMQSFHANISVSVVHCIQSQSSVVRIVTAVDWTEG